MGKILHLLLRLLLQCSYAIVALVVISLITYFFGYGALRGVVGNDSNLAYSYILWINNFFPHIPWWYPLAGAGTSIVIGYAMLAPLLVILTRLAAHVSLFQAFVWWQFLPILLGAVLIYLFSWFRLKNQTVGFFAALFSLLMPMGWSQIFDWGFYSQNISFPFFTLGFLLFDWYFDTYINQGLTRKTRTLLVVFGLSFVLTFLAHPVTGVSLAITASAYGVLYSLLLSGNKLINLRKGIMGVVIGMVPAIFLSSFYLIPFLKYSGIANREGLNNVNPATRLGHSIGLFLQLTPYGSDAYFNDTTFIYRNISVPVLIWALSIIGTILGFIFNKKIVALGLLLWLGILFLTYTPVLVIVNNISPLFGLLLSERNWTSLLISFAPVVAAYALWEIVHILFIPLWRGIQKIPRYMWAFRETLMAGELVATFILGFLSIYLFRNVSLDTSYKNILINYGPVSVINIYDVWNDVERPCFTYKVLINNNINDCPTIVQQIQWNNWPRIPEHIVWKPDPKDAGARLLFGKLPQTKNGLFRIDLTPNLGGLSKEMGLFTQASQVNSYTYQLSLITEMWGYMQGVMYSTILSKSPTTVNELGAYFGINKIFLNANDGKDVLQKYQDAGWKKTFEIPKGPSIWDNPVQTQLADIAIKPRVLVIGDPKKGVSDSVFRTAITGALPYKDAILVMGSKNIDDYSLDQLSNFQMIILMGYSYNNQQQAFSLLDTYLKAGGSLYIDTGWQYMTKDYQIDNAPGFFPSDRLTWTTVGKATDFSIDGSQVGSTIQGRQFSPLIWSGLAWGISSAGNVSDLHSYAKPVVVSGNTPLVTAGTYGQGRVVWSGMNLLAHATTYKNQDEEKLIGSLWKYLLHDTGGPTIPVSIQRNNPDQIVITVGKNTEGASFYFREAFYPNWSLHLISGQQTTNIPLYSAGPGFIFAPLPPIKTGDTLVLSFETGWLIVFSRLVSLLTLGSLLVWIFFQNYGILLRKLPKHNLGKHMGKLKKALTADEEEY